MIDFPDWAAPVDFPDWAAPVVMWKFVAMISFPGHPFFITLYQPFAKSRFKYRNNGMTYGLRYLHSKRHREIKLRDFSLVTV